MKQLVFENDHAVVWVYPEKGIIHHKFKKFIWGDSFRQTMMKAADAFEKYGCTKWLSDDRNNSALRPEDVEWGQQEWEPRVMKAGWKHWGIILPEKVVGQLNMRKIIDRYKGMGVNVKIFSDPDEAMAWLEKP